MELFIGKFGMIFLFRFLISLTSLLVFYMAFNKEELAKLTPSERIKKLKEIEEKSKKEVEELETVLQESKKLLNESELELERTEIEKESSEDPLIDLTDLLKQDADSLEASVANTPLVSIEEPRDIFGLYQRVTQLAYQGQGIDARRKEELTTLYQEVNQAATYVTERYGSPSEEFQAAADSSKRIIKDLLGEFYSKNQYNHPG